MRFAALPLLATVLIGCDGASRPDGTSTTGSDNEQVNIADALAGYEVTLPKQQAEEFRDVLNANVKEEQILAFLRKLLADKRVDWRLKAVAAIVAADVLLFKKKMNDNMGPNGVVIRVWGVGGQETVCTTIPPGTWEWILSDDWKLKKKVATTVPVYWTVTPRK